MSLPPAEQESVTPRLWVPGLTYVTDRGGLELGCGAGYSSRDRAFCRLRCGHRGSVSTWTHVAWVVPRNTLDASLIASHGILLPESMVDPKGQPHAHRWLREQPLVCLAGERWRQLADAGVRVYRVAFDATGDRILEVEGAGGATKPSSLSVTLEELERATTASPANGSSEVSPDPSAVDRALRVVSSGAVDEASLLNAFDARNLVEDGYGYRGAPEGQRVDPCRLKRDVHILDALFGQIFERALGMRAAAERLLIALARAPAGARAVSVPIYGRARRSIVPAARVDAVAGFVVRGQRRDALELCAERRWSVERPDEWSPALPPTCIESSVP